MLIKMATEKEIGELTTYFQEIDTDGTGMIDAKELKNVVKRTSIKMTDQEIDALIKEIDEDGKCISYSEFIAAAIDLRSIVSPQRVRAIFHQMDTDGSGVLTQDDLYFAFQKQGEEISKDQLQHIIEVHDRKGKGVIDFQDFCLIFFTQDEIMNSAIQSPI